jgi:hypothetical protein
VLDPRRNEKISLRRRLTAFLEELYCHCHRGKLLVPGTFHSGEAASADYLVDAKVCEESVYRLYLAACGSTVTKVEYMSLCICAMGESGREGTQRMRGESGKIEEGVKRDRRGEREEGKGER